MIKNNLFILDIPIYFQQIVFITGYEDEELVDLVSKKLKKIGIRKDTDVVDFMKPMLNTGTALGRTVLYDNGGIAVRLYPGVDPHTASGAAILCHEVVHACTFLFERIGMPHTVDTDEAYAYLFGLIIKSFYEKI